MGKKYRRYKNFVEKYLDSDKGKRFFNIVYSVGAAIVILGAMFKILHLPFGNQMLMIGMITEAIVFLLSAFEKPGKDYKWEEVYPVLADDEDFIPRAERQKVAVQANVGKPSVAVQSTTTAGGTVVNPNVGKTADTGFSGSGSVVSGGTIVTGGTVVVDGGNTLEASEKYVDQLSKMSENMEKFAEVTNSLGQISEKLLGSFQTVINNSEGIGNNTQGYVTQMEALNRNITGLNTIYEIQLKGVSGQINTIEQINAGLDRMKRLYDGSLADSSIFKTETEKMAHQLAELNQVYARLLQAMTTNMNLGGGFNPNAGNTNAPTQP